MREFSFDIKGLEELRTAVARNPQKVMDEVQSFLTRGMAAYQRTIHNNPWRMGGTGGGAPQASGNLSATHRIEQLPWQARIFPTAPYAAYVHGIEGWARKRKYQLRPWLDYAKNTNEKKIEELQNTMLSNIVADLAK